MCKSKSRAYVERALLPAVPLTSRSVEKACHPKEGYPRSTRGFQHRTSPLVAVVR
jgi:hypothetical protein